MTLGLVMISICVRPASWLSAESELVRKRIWRISSRDGNRPPRNPLTWNTAPAAPAIWVSTSASSSGSSGSSSISACSSVVGERVAATIVGRRRVVHDHFFLKASDLQRDGLIHRAASERELPFVRFEPRELDVEV